MGNNLVRNAVTPHRSVRRQVIFVKEKAPVIVVEPEQKVQKRPVRRSAMFENNWWKDMENAKEGREAEWEEEGDQ